MGVGVGYVFIQKVKNTAAVFSNCFRRFGRGGVQNLLV